MSQSLRRLTRQAGEWVWQQRFNRLYSPRAGLTGDPRQLRLLLGTNSGALDWVAGLLRRSGPRIRYYNEPLRRYTPPLALSNGADRCALGFRKSLPDGHPLVRALRLLVEPDNPWSTERMSNRIPHARYEPGICMVKETHALLASEALARGFQCRSLLLVTEPVRTLDRIFAGEGLESSYLLHEQQAVLTPGFLSRFMSRDARRLAGAVRILRQLPDSRERTILGRALAVGLINRMFRTLGARYPGVTAVSLNELSRSPRSTVQLIVGLLGEEWRDSAEIQVRDASVPSPGNGGAELSIPLLSEPLRFLSIREAVTCRDMLAECGLLEPETDELLSRTLGINVFPHRSEGRPPGRVEPAVSSA